MLPERVFRRIVQSLGILFSSFILLQGLFTLCGLRMFTEAPDYISNKWWTQASGILLFFGVTWLLTRDRAWRTVELHGERVFWLLLVSVSAFMFWWVCNTKFVYCNDLRDIYDCAYKLLAGDYSPWSKGGIGYMWPHQDATVLLAAGLLSVCTLEQSFLCMYIISIMSWAATVVAVYFSMRLLNREKATANIQGIMLVLYLPYAFLLMQMYNDHLGYGLTVCGSYFALKYTKTHRIRELVAMGLLFILGISFKQNSMIILIGVMIVLFFDYLAQKRDYIKNMLILLSVVAAIFFGISLPTRCVSLITGLEASEGNSKWSHIAMGLTECINHAPGWFDGYNISLFAQNGYDTKLTAQAAQASVQKSVNNFVKNPDYAMWFFSTKLATEWNNPTFECFSTQNGKDTPIELSGLVKSTINDGGKVNMLLLWVWDIGQSVLLFGVLLYFVHIRQEETGALLPGILFIGAFVFFLFWETKSRYVAPYFFMLIPYAFQGYRICIEQLRARKTQIALAAVIAAALLTALADSGPLAVCFKLNQDTDDYYEYIHENHNNFVFLRY